MNSISSKSSFASLVQGFFCVRLVQQQNVSDRTVASYRDTFRLLLAYFAQVHRKPPTALAMTDLDAPAIDSGIPELTGGKETAEHGPHSQRPLRRHPLVHEIRRRTSVGATTSASLPDHPCRVLAIPLKRFSRPMLGSLSRDEMAAVLEAPDGSTWSGRRDRVLFALMYNTGARVSEVIAVRRADVSLDASRSVRLMGKGRKGRTVPLWKSTAQHLREWTASIGTDEQSYLFPNRSGGQLSRSGVEKRLNAAVEVASCRCPSLRGKKVSPHTLRHTTAMHLLQSGVDITVIALWLGHESTGTTHQYVEANLAMKDQALAKLEEIPTKKVRFNAKDDLLRFLDGL